MSIPVFTHAAVANIVWDPYAAGDDRDVLILRFGRGRSEQRIARDGGPFRAYSVGFRVNDDTRKRIDAFFRARGFQAESFLFRDPNDYALLGLSLGTSIASQTVFSMPTTGDGRGAYPEDVAGVLLKDDGVAVARTVQTDARTITASVAPAASSVMTADVTYLRRVRLDGAYPAWTPLGEGAVWEASMRWLEVPA